MLSTELEDARNAIASEIGPDVAEFTPPDEKNLLGWDDLLLLGGTFLTAFLIAFAKSAGEEAGKKLGKALVDYIAEKIKAQRAESPDDQEKALETAASAAAEIALHAPQLMAAISESVEKALASALGQDAEPNIAQKVAARVRQEALKLLTPKAA